MKLHLATIGLLASFSLSAQVPAEINAVVKDSKKIITRIGLAGCLKHLKPAPALHNYVTQNLDLMLWLGDNHYGDTRDPKALETHYNALAKVLKLTKVNNIPTMATWDDHDYGWNNSAASYPIKKESRELFLKFWGMSKMKVMKQREGIYHSRILGPKGKRLQIIMLDTRYAKTKERMLSQKQWTWLATELEKPAELRMIVSSQQILLSPNSAFETWTKSGNEQQRLFKLIQEKSVDGVFFVSGDQHYGEIANLPKALCYDAWEFTFAGINQDEKPSLHDYRVGKVIHAKHKTGRLEINWTKDPVISFLIHDVLGKEIHRSSLKKSQLLSTSSIQKSKK